MLILHSQIIKALLRFEVEDSGKGGISCRFTVSSGMHASEVVNLLHRVKFFEHLFGHVPFAGIYLYAWTVVFVVVVLVTLLGMPLLSSSLLLRVYGLDYLMAWMEGFFSVHSNDRFFCS